ncbi:MAG: histidine phosphatase family protein [Verrucomicrobiota bacterium]
MKTILTSILVLGSALLASAADKAELIAELKKGGLIVYFRHASTEKDYADQVKADPNDGSTQRVLSEKGWQESIHIGHAFKFHQIPVGNVHTSQYFRAWQTAYLAFGKYQKTEKLNFLPYEDYTDEQIAKMKERTMPFLTKIPAEGTNTIIVAHDDPFEACTGIYPDPQGIAHILRPKKDGSFEVLGAITPTEW